MRLLVQVLAMAAFHCPGLSLADAEFVFSNLDEPGVGFNDPAEVGPAEGNAGRTLGEQRQEAFLHALRIWGDALDSDVPIEVGAWFEPLPCGILASTPEEVVLGPSGERTVSLPLASRLARTDLAPDAPDVSVVFNSLVDECGGRRVHYELDGELVAHNLAFTALHEIAHGLGFSGASRRASVPHAFDMLVYDVVLGKTLAAMSDDDRAAATEHARGLVWTGEAVHAEVSRFLLSGVPAIRTVPALPGFTGVVSDLDVGARLSVSGPLNVAPEGMCSLPEAVAGTVVMRSWSGCDAVAFARSASEAGAVGVLMVDDRPGSQSPSPIDTAGVAPIDIPVLVLLASDAELLRAQTTEVEVALTVDEGQLLGADPMGRIYIANDQGYDFSHWDPVARPNLLMEPTDRLVPSFELDLTRAALVDLGWSKCGDGITTVPETCDDGARNGEEGRCAEDCEPHFPSFCGNAIVEEGEQCDKGQVNSDELGTDCRSGCTVPTCGDGVVDEGEECDAGDYNDDHEPGGCRTDCTEILCGNWELDPGEECDMGSLNSDELPNRCRISCRWAYCGDGVVDRGEDCDPADASTATCHECVRVDSEQLDAGLPDAGGPSGDQDDAEDRRGHSAASCGCHLATPDRGRWEVLIALSGVGGLLFRRGRRRPEWGLVA